MLFRSLEAQASQPLARGERVFLSIRPEDVHLHKQRPAGATNLIEGKVESVMFVGEFLDCRVNTGSQELRTRQHPNAVVQPGQAVIVELPAESCAVLREDFDIAPAAVDDGNGQPAAAAS